MFQELILNIQQKRLLDNGRAITQKEMDLINKFKGPDQPYSLMFKVLLEGNNF
jgi:hypothetical protein